MCRCMVYSVMATVYTNVLDHKSCSFLLQTSFCYMLIRVSIIVNILLSILLEEDVR